jgi:hypothetical protein
VDAEAAHQVDGDLDVGLGDELALDFDHRLRARHGQRHQQRGKILRGDVAAHPRRPAADRACANHKGRESLLLQVRDLGAHAPQRLDQIADRALVHAR